MGQNTKVTGVLGNDTDVDDVLADFTVTSIRTGGTEGSGTAGTLGTALNGTYGTLLVSADGTYTYTLYTQAQNASAYNTVQALDDGLTALTDVFNYTMTDGTANDTATLTISITGANDAPIAVNDVNSLTEDTGSVGQNTKVTGVWATRPMSTTFSPTSRSPPSALAAPKAAARQVRWALLSTVPTARCWSVPTAPTPTRSIPRRRMRPRTTRCRRWTTG